MTDENRPENENLISKLPLKDREDGVEAFAFYVHEIESRWNKAFTEFFFEAWFEKVGHLTEEELRFAVKELVCRQPGYHLPAPSDVLEIVRPNLQPVEELPPRVEMTEEEKAEAMELIARFKEWANG
jgi:hypothetical protein